MVGPSPRTVTHSSRRSLRGIASLVLVFAGGGCSLVPKTTLDESRRVNQTLRADNARLKDVALNLQSRNQDLSDRAVDDSRRLAVQDEAIERLEQSLAVYQTDRDKIEKAFANLKHQAQLAAEASVSTLSADFPPPSPSTSVTTTTRSAASRIEDFAKAHPNWSFDPTTQSLVIPTDILFETSSARFRTGAAETIEELVQAVSTSIAQVDLEIRPGTTRSSVQPVSVDGGEANDERTRFLSVSRAARLRDSLLVSRMLTPGQVHLLSPIELESVDQDGGQRLSIRVTSHATPQAALKPALDSTTQPAR